MNKKLFTGILLTLLSLFACGDTGQEAGFEQRCRVKGIAPYLDTPYPSIHGSAGNNERIFCDGPQKAPVPGWSALDGYLVFNPVTVGKKALYVIVARAKGCKLWRVDLLTGKAQCFPREDPEKLSFGVLGGSPELDEHGNVYVTDGWDDHVDGMVSYAPDGSLRWRTGFKGLRKKEPDFYMPPLGLALLSMGYAATVTPDGMVVVVRMNDGKVMAHFSIPDETGMAPLPGKGSTTMSKVPKYLQCRMERVLGKNFSADELSRFLAGGTGGSGSYTDNTIAANKDMLFVVGGGKDDGSGFAKNGALLALKVTPKGNRADISLYWYMELNGATGSSPTIDPSGHWIVESDVADNGRARLVVGDLSECKKAASKGSRLCKPAWTYVLRGGPLLASVSASEDGVVYAWNQGKDEDPNNPAPELVAVAPPKSGKGTGVLKWTAAFPPKDHIKWDSTEWSSTVLVLDNMVIGTVTHLKAISMGGMPIPTKTSHELVGVRRSDGKVLWRGVPMPDDSINSPLLGPDGNIYVPIQGMLDFLKIPEGGGRIDSCADFDDHDYQGGIVQFLSK